MRDSLGMLTGRAARLCAQLLAERVAALGVKPAQFRVLCALAAQDGLTQRELMERIDVEQGTITRTLQRMVRDGLLKRAAHEMDKRASRWRLTARARRVLEPARRLESDAQRELLAGLGAREQAALIAALQRVIHNAHSARST